MILQRKILFCLIPLKENENIVFLVEIGNIYLIQIASKLFSYSQFIISFLKIVSNWWIDCFLRRFSMFRTCEFLWIPVTLFFDSREERTFPLRFPCLPSEVLKLISNQPPIRRISFNNPPRVLEKGCFWREMYWICWLKSVRD